MRYQAQPKAKELIEKSVAYATFSNFGMKILIAGGGTGSGVVTPKNGAKLIYMNMAEVQAGPGIGIKPFQNIFVFQTQDALNDFVNSGWTFGGQVTDSGLAAEITGKGTKYFKNTDLNK
jgi:lipid-binding SYLF domain-containing protein